MVTQEEFKRYEQHSFNTVLNADQYLVSRAFALELRDVWLRMALALARSCRAAGLTVELDLSSAAFGIPFKRADRRSARWAAVIGEAEAAEGMVVLRELRAQVIRESRGAAGPWRGADPSAAGPCRAAGQGGGWMIDVPALSRRHLALL